MTAKRPLLPRPLPRMLLLAQTIAGMKKISHVTTNEVELLTKGRLARNYIVHESGKIGPITNCKLRTLPTLSTRYARLLSTLQRAIMLCLCGILQFRKSSPRPNG